MAGAAFTDVRGGGLSFLRQEPTVSHERVEVPPLVSRAQNVKIEKTVQTLSMQKHNAKYDDTIVSKIYEITISNESSKALTGIVFGWTSPGTAGRVTQPFDKPLPGGEKRVVNVGVGRAAFDSPVELIRAGFEDGSIEGDKFEGIYQLEGRKLDINLASHAIALSLMEQLRGIVRPSIADWPKDELLAKLTEIEQRPELIKQQPSSGEGPADAESIKSGERHAAMLVREIVVTAKFFINSGKEERGREWLRLSFDRLSKYYDVFEFFEKKKAN